MQYFTRSLTFLLICAVALLVTGSVAFATPSGDAVTLYLPLIAKPRVDLAVTQIVVTQGIQTNTNGVPLVAQRPTVVRVFAKTAVGDAVTNATVRLSASRNGAPIGSMTLGPRTAPLAPTHEDYGSTFNAILPPGWLSGDVAFTAVVDPDNTLLEVSEFNNTLTNVLAFNNVPNLRVTVVPIDYTHQGSTQPGFYPGNRVDHISNWLRRTYPVADVDLSIYPSNFAFSGNLGQGDDWVALLNALTARKWLDNADQYSPTVYYGFVPVQNSAQQWFFAGIAGIGWIGGSNRTSVGLNLGNNDNTGSLAGHEIGHNLGRSHAPCGLSGGDPNYPYSGAVIGQYGLDGIRAGAPQPIAPNARYDMMSYCDPIWLSDYTYKALMNDQISKGQSGATTAVASETLLIRGQLTAAGQATLEPVYGVVRQPAGIFADSDYAVALLDAAGGVLAIHPVQLSVAEEEGVAARAFIAAVPLPDAPVTAVRLLANGATVAERPLHSNLAGLALHSTVSQTASSATLRWGVADVPAVVRYTVDDGASWVTLGVDVLGGVWQVDTTHLPGGENGRFEIILADSDQPLRLAATLPAPLPNQPPLVWISGETEQRGETAVVLHAHSSDAEDGALTTRRWFVDGAEVGREATLTLAALPAGRHVVTLEATDSAGETAVAQTVVVIRP